MLAQVGTVKAEYELGVVRRVRLGRQSEELRGRDRQKRANVLRLGGNTLLRAPICSAEAAVPSGLTVMSGMEPCPLRAANPRS